MGSDNGGKTSDSGLPQLTESEKKSSLAPLIGFLVIPLAVGAAIAFGIYTLGARVLYDNRINVLVSNELHWAALGLVIFGRAIAFLNLYPTTFKSQIMRGNSGNLRSNPFIYKAIGKDAKENAIIFNDEGAVGAYNRANRSIHHLIENFGVLVAGYFLVSSVFPFPAFVTILFFSLGRIMHQVGYTTGYGGHGIGFAIALVATVTIEGLLLIISLKGLKAF